VIEDRFCDVIDMNVRAEDADVNDEDARNEIRRDYREYITVKPCAVQAGFDLNL